MEMSKNPFLSKSFVEIWSKHFNGSTIPNRFQFIRDIVFVKANTLDYYINVGKNLTNGIPYHLLDDQYDDYKGKAFLIRDLPEYLVIGKPRGKRLKVKKVSQYEGYLTRIDHYDSLEHYLKTIYRSNTRSKLRRNMSRLETCFEVEYIMYYGDISSNEFKYVFDTFYNLLEKRYQDKNEPCGELEPKLWNYYCELAFQMIHEKTASLFVIYCDGRPIGVTFSYHFESYLMEALTVFDIDFYRFNIGHTTILKMLEWSFNNGITTFDYTQGDFEYKKRWSDTTYETFYHVLYDSKSIKKVLLANGLVSYFRLKRFFRDQKFNEKYHQMKHQILHKNRQKRVARDNFSIELIPDEQFNFDKLESVELYGNHFDSQRRVLFDFLYMNPESVKQLKVYKKNDSLFYVKGQKNLYKMVKND